MVSVGNAQPEEGVSAQINKKGGIIDSARGMLIFDVK
jgi:hypothetical protein